MSFGYNVLGFGSHPARGSSIDITYLSISGGASGGKSQFGDYQAGGGGAGGVVSSTATVTGGSSSTVTIGAGGASLSGTRFKRSSIFNYWN